MRPDIDLVGLEMKNLFLFFIWNMFLSRTRFAPCLYQCIVSTEDEGGLSRPSLGSHKGHLTIFSWVIFSPDPLSSVPSIRLKKEESHIKNNIRELSSMVLLFKHHP